MPSKYCPNCQKIISTAGSAPNFCYYCRRDLRDMPVLPPVIYHSERLKQLEKLKLEYKTEPVQLKFF